MFFGPTLNHFKRRNEELHVLCMSNGNADGLGTLRQQELYDSLSVFGIQQDKISVVDDVLQDGMAEKWSEGVISALVTDYVDNHGIQTILTFDKAGVSLHPNHSSVHKASLRVENATKCHLRTHSIPVKYSLFTQPLQASSLSFSSTFSEYVLTVAGMRRHRSQLVWFRVAYVLLSRYMWMNEFDCM